MERKAENQGAGINMKLTAEEMSGLKRVGKYEPLPGTANGEVDRKCPVCLDINLVSIKPCCGSPKGYLSCRKCGYKEQKA